MTAGQAPILCTDLDRACRRGALRAAIGHLHTIWTLPPGDADFSARRGRIKATFTARWRAEGGVERPVSRAQRRGVWQQRFWEHALRDEDDFGRYRDNIHYNPVKHGLVRGVREWPVSSFHRFERAGQYDVDWGGGSGSGLDLAGLDETAME